jgi:hypothetical protein
MCSEAVPLRSSDDRVCQIVMGLTRRSASKLWEIPKLVCTTHHVCTHTSRKRNMYRYHFVVGVGLALPSSKSRLDRRPTLRHSNHGYIAYPKHSALLTLTRPNTGFGRWQSSVLGHKLALAARVSPSLSLCRSTKVQVSGFIQIGYRLIDDWQKKVGTRLIPLFTARRLA